MKLILSSAIGIFGLMCASFGAEAATLVADYEFNGDLSSSIAGAPALTAVDPLGVATFSNGVYNYGGSTTPTQQGGLSFDNSGNLLTADDYSISMRFLFNDRNGAWRRIVDVQGRQSDNGFYVDPSNNLDIYPVQGSSGAFSTGQFHTVLLTVGGGEAKAYLDNVLQFTTTTTVMNLQNSAINLFLDNLSGGGQGEWSSGSIDYAKFYNGVVTVGSVPEVSTWAMLLLGFAGCGFAGFRRKLAGSLSVSG